MAKKKQEAELTPAYENESVIPTREERIADFSIYSLFAQPDEFSNGMDGLRSRRLYCRLMETLKSGRYEDEKDAIDASFSDEGRPLYERYGDSPDDALAKIRELTEKPAEVFLDKKEASFRSAFLPYLESVLIAGMRAKVLVNTWWRLVNYGFSAQPFDETKEPDLTGEDGAKYYSVSDFPYRSVSEMPAKDKEAFRQVTLDVYYVLESICSLYHTTEPARADEEDNTFRPYPKEGYSMEKLAKDWEYETPGELYDSWEHEPELYLSFALYRFDEALYYAFKYVGNEYKEYLSSLNVAEDWNGASRRLQEYAFYYEGQDYNSIMK